MAPYVERIVRLGIKHNVVFGLNVNGIHKQRLYPCPEFWEIVGRLGATGILELDAHSDGPFNDKHINKAVEMAKRFNVKLIEKLF